MKPNYYLKNYETAWKEKLLSIKKKIRFSFQINLLRLVVFKNGEKLAKVIVLPWLKWILDGTYGRQYWWLVF